MEFSSIWYFSFWSLVSLLSSTAGICALRQATIPVSDVDKFYFELFIVSSVCFSTFHAFLNRPALEHDQDDLNAAHRYKILVRFYEEFLLITLPIIYFFGFHPLYFTIVGYKLAAVTLLFSVVPILPHVVELIRMSSKYSQALGNLLSAFAGLLIMYPSHTLCCVLSQGFLLLSLNSRVLDLGLHLYWICTPVLILSACISEFYVIKLITTSTIHNHRKIIDIVFGILGTILAQYYFRVESVALMLCLLAFAIAWLGILANVQPHTDFGIFQFIVTASLECAVSLFGLHSYTFLVGCGGIVLMILRWKLESVSLRHPGRKEIVVRGWKRLEELYGNDFNDSNIQTHDQVQPSEGASNTQRLGIQRRLTQRFERLWSPHACFGA